MRRLVRRLSRCVGLRRFVRDEEGTAAIEFAVVSIPFLALMFAILETAVVFFAGQTLETAVADSARLIMTGQAQSQGFDQAAFKTAVCSRVKAMFDCNTGMLIDVRNYQNFSSVDLSKPIDSQGNLVNNFTFQPGGPGDIVVVRVMYQWPIWVKLLGFDLGNMANGKRLLIATAAFRNEPYK